MSVRIGCWEGRIIGPTTSWKKTDLERLNGRETPFVSRREQRRLDQAQGLVPFAVKLHQDLARRVQTLAQERGQPLGELVAELLENGLEAISKR